MSHSLSCTVSSRELQLLNDAGLRFQRTQQGTRYRVSFASEREAQRASSLLRQKREQQPGTAPGRRRN